MNDDDWFINVLRDYTYERSVGSPMNTQNIYDMLKYKNIIITSSSIKKIENRILNEKN